VKKNFVGRMEAGFLFEIGVSNPKVKLTWGVCPCLLRMIVVE
jgi:hypothetical protein